MSIFVSLLMARTLDMLGHIMKPTPKRLMNSLQYAYFSPLVMLVIPTGSFQLFLNLPLLSLALHSLLGVGNGISECSESEFTLSESGLCTGSSADIVAMLLASHAPLNA